MADEEEDYEDIPMMAGEVGVDYAAEERELDLQVYRFFLFSLRECLGCVLLSF